MLFYLGNTVIVSLRSINYFELYAQRKTVVGANTLHRCERNQRGGLLRRGHDKVSDCSANPLRDPV